MIDLANVTINERFLVGQTRYPLKDGLWVYTAKDNQKSIPVLLLIIAPDFPDEEFKSFFRYLEAQGLRQQESTYFSFENQTYYYSAFEIQDRKELSIHFKKWQEENRSFLPIDSFDSIEIAPINLDNESDPDLKIPPLKNSEHLDQNLRRKSTPHTQPKRRYLFLGASGMFIVCFFAFCVSTFFVPNLFSLWESTPVSITETIEPTLTSSPKNSSPTPTVRSNVSGEMYLCVSATDGAVVRSSPSVKSKKIGFLQYEDCKFFLTYSESEGKIWLQLSPNQGLDFENGWVRSDLLDTSTLPPTILVTPTP